MRMHLDLEAGISGNMFLGACLDLGLELRTLKEALATLGVSGWQLEVKKELRGGMSGLHVSFRVPHAHAHRHLAPILAMIHASELPEPVKQRADAIFTKLAEAEAAVHGVSVEEVHFHEVGAMDAILDICGAAFAVWKLGVTQVSASPVPTGSGYVNGAHGRLPVPVPAVVELLRRHHAPLRPDAVEAELVTPTGAAILVTLVDRYGPLELTRVDRVGCGLGSRELHGRGNLLRILVQEETLPLPPETGSGLLRDRVVVLSCHVDDMNPEWYGPLWEHLMGAGALDMALLPMTMKKGRPGVRIEVVAHPGREEALARLMLTHTTSLGVRMDVMERFVLPRTEKILKTPWGTVRVKEAAGIWRLEHDDLEQLARRQGWSLPETQQNLAPMLALAIGKKSDSRSGKKRTTVEFKQYVP
ncbi:MAG: nickel pincer cofactor biosynthesis protein LarC [Magnetococcales bacterium]|nr:nickel pincer cofactor biosynthesis protein LarC [Magnetococcales bacterium]